MSDRPGSVCPAAYPIRLNRYLASCGVCARRKADELISSGRVYVDGKQETALGRVLASPSEVCVDGVPVAPARPVYIVMNKPRGVLSASSDDREDTVLDLLPEFYRSLRPFPVGRLDKESEGLIILTNDGQFAQELIHPSKGVKRTYLVYLRYSIDEKRMKEWQRGVIINERFVKPISVTRADEYAEGRCFKVVLGEGIKREIRLMAEALDNRVVRLRRVGIGKMVLRRLPLGAFNEFSRGEMSEMLMSGGEV